MYLSAKIFLLIYCCLAYACCQQVYNIPIRHGQPYQDIKGPGYPNDAIPYETTVQWNFVVESDSFIKILCDDLRMGQIEPWTEECPYTYISFDEGNGEKKVCGSNKEKYKFVSKGPRLTVRMVSTSGGSGFMKCTAYNMREPTPKIVTVKPDGRVTIIRSQRPPAPNLDQMWIVNSTPGTKMSFQCTFHFDDSKPCYKKYVTVDNGEEVKEYCGAQRKLVIFTKGNYGKIRVNLDEGGDQEVKCVVQVVTGPHPNEHENAALIADPDSAEHGVARGTRQTSCKCGWINKIPGRIINGGEAGLHEFPWMVLLNFYHDTVHGRYYSYCGASIVTSRHVLTAAHCLAHRDTKQVVKPEAVTMRLAVHNSQEKTQREQHISATEVFIHEKYFENLSYDIAIIYTKENIQFSDIIGPVCLTREDVPIINKRLKIMGWGQTEHGTGSSVLLKAKAMVMHSLLCGNLPEWDICSNTTHSTSCYGDSGGPLVLLDPETNRYNQISLVSRGTVKNCQNGFLITTKISYFYEWIQNIITRTDSSQNICQKI